MTDTTPYRSITDLAVIADAVRTGALPQRVVVTGGPELAGAEAPPGLDCGARSSSSSTTPTTRRSTT